MLIEGGENVWVWEGRSDWMFGETCTVSVVTCTLRHAVVMMLKLRKVRCAGHVECIQDMKNAYKGLIGNP
jgi:hypothetical protein